MKRIRQTTKSRAYLRRRSDRLASRRKRRALRLLYHRRTRPKEPKLKQPEALPFKLDPEVVIAPAVFSVVNNPGEMLRFIRLLMEHVKHRPAVRIDMSGITALECDGVALLLSTLSALKGKTLCRLTGNEPKDIVLKQRLKNYGFYDFVRSVYPKGAASRSKGVITEGRDIVDPSIAKRVRKQCSEDLGQGAPHRNKPLYTSLIECMANTRNHAHGPPITSEADDVHVRKPWWMAVSNDPVKRLTKVAFIDRGVGIVQSVRLKGLKWIVRSIGLMSDADILVEVMEGKIASRTGLSYRGKGLPKILGHVKNGEFAALILITGCVYLDAKTMTHERLATPFDGTFIYWEIAQ